MVNKISYVLQNGSRIPSVGLGTWQINDRETIKCVLKDAFEIGYRLIDTASAYSNEMNIGRALVDLGLPREEFILSDKVWNTSRGYDAVIEACKKSLKKLKTDYLDIYLIHWPASVKLHPDWKQINSDTWSGMEELYRQGLVRNIGVCNFKEHHIDALKSTADIMPQLNQFEFHPGMLQEGLLDYCNNSKIQVVASSPLGNGQILENNIIKDIANKHGVSAAQICLAWGIKKGTVVIPKTTHIDRLRDNFLVNDIDLTDEDMQDIDAMSYCGGIGIDSDEVTQFG